MSAANDAAELLAADAFDPNANANARDLAVAQFASNLAQTALTDETVALLCSVLERADRNVGELMDQGLTRDEAVALVVRRFEAMA